MSCLLEKGENTKENRDTTSSDLGKKMISSDLLISFNWKEWRKQRYHKNNYRSEEVRQRIKKEKSEDEEVLWAYEKNRENRKIEKKMKSLWCMWVRKTWEEEREREKEVRRKKDVDRKEERKVIRKKWEKFFYF